MEGLTKPITLTPHSNLSYIGHLDPFRQVVPSGGVSPDAALPLAEHVAALSPHVRLARGLRYRGVSRGLGVDDVDGLRA